MKVAYDLHIHTALSPCGDKDMTPNNIVNMSILKGLEVIAITDHNSCRNVDACIRCAVDTPLLVIPGMEVETAEEIHVVCLLPDVERALELQNWVYSRLPPMQNNESIFGSQLILNEKDEIIDIEDRMLLVATNITINDIFDTVHNKLAGVVLPAHIDRESNSLLASFGVMPEDILISCVEISKKSQAGDFLNKIGLSDDIKRIYSSDAHYLGNINERENYLEVEDNTCEGIIKFLRSR